MPASGPERLRTRLSLIGRLKDWGDNASWQEFSDLYGQLIRNFVIKQGVAESDADDVVQDTVISVAKAIHKWDPGKGSFKAWLLRIAHNRFIDHFRRQPRWRKANRPSRTATRRTATVERLADPNGRTPEEICDEGWRNNLVQMAWERLKVRKKPVDLQIYHLHVTKGQPVAKVAKAFGVSNAQVHLVKCRVVKEMEKEVKKLQREFEARPERNGSRKVSGPRSRKRKQ